MNNQAVTPLLPIAGPGHNLGHGHGKPAASGQDSDALKAARQFEALFVKQLLSEVKISGGMGGQDSARSDFVDSMWRDQISKHLSSQGQGLGLAQVIAGQLQGKPATTARADGGLEFRSDLRASTTPASPGLQMYQNLLPDAPRFSDAGEFVKTLKPYMEKAAQELGVSPKILLAQAALETGWGQHMPSDRSGQPSNNLFGIKASPAWQGASVSSPTHEFDGQAMQPVQDDFRAYSGVQHSVADYVQFLKSNPRYSQALQHGGSDKNFVQGLKSAGYATDPQYVEKVFDVAGSPTLNRYWDAI